MSGTAGIRSERNHPVAGLDAVGDDGPVILAEQDVHLLEPEALLVIDKIDGAVAHRLALQQPAPGRHQRQLILQGLHGTARRERRALGLVDITVGDRALERELAQPLQLLVGQALTASLDLERRADVLFLDGQLRLRLGQLVVDRVDAQQLGARGQDLAVP